MTQDDIELSQDDAHKSKSNRIWGITLNETILLAAFPFIAYLFTFAYQAGYLSAFRLPPQLISVNVVDVFNIGASVLAVLASVLLVINFISGFLPEGTIPRPIAGRISLAAPLFLIVFPQLVYFKWGPISTFYAFLLVLGVIVMFLPPLLTRRYKGTYLQKMEALDNRAVGADPWSGTLISRGIDYVGREALVVIIYLLLSLNLVYNAGRGAALNQKVFHITDTTPETVVLFMTSDRLVCAPFDRTTKKVEPAFSVIPISGNTNITLRLAEVGPLELDEIPTYLTPMPTKTPSPTGTVTVSPTATQIP